MTEDRNHRSSHTTGHVDAPRPRVFEAFTKPEALQAWLSPKGMAGRVHDFTPGEGGGYRMDLDYNEPLGFRGLTLPQAYHYRARFTELDPPARVVMAITFEDPRHEWSGVMTMAVTLEEADGGTDLTFDFDNLPEAITPEDNDAGTRMALEKLADYLTGMQGH